jgi:hypothetical protein
MAEAQNAPAPPAQEESRVWSVMRFVVMMFLFNRAMTFLFAPSSSTKSGGKSSAYTNILLDGDSLNFKVYLHEDPVDEIYLDKLEPLWEENDLFYNYEEFNYRSQNLTVPLSYELQHNGTMYLTVLFTALSSVVPKPVRIQETIPLTQYMQLVAEEEVNLISDAPPTRTNTKEWVMHWKPSLDINLVYDQTVYPGFPPQLAHIRKTPDFHYYPILYMNDFWVLRENMIPLNDTITEVPLSLTYNTLWNYKYMAYIQFVESTKINQSYGLQSESEFDIIKKMILETNPYFLGLTFIVTLLHSVFEFMAFKSDIEFWKGRESLKGLSTKLLAYNFIAQIVITLYLLDSQETSFLILAPMVIGIAIELWKLNKGFDISFKNTFPFIDMKEKEAHKEANTDEFDNTATKYLTYVMIPIVGAYSVYSLYYDSYKSWYSWIVGSLARMIYTMGFLMMTPQLYINYKLQSVEHMPWKMLTYRALNTFIDDMFAMIISMPTMHRLACFRDDVIFVIYLYQRWKYRVDPNRNRYGENELPPEDKPKQE